MSFIGTQVPMAHVSSAVVDIPLEFIATTSPADQIFSWFDEHLPNLIKEGVQKANEKILAHVDAKSFKRGESGATIVVIGIISDLKTGKIAIHGWNEGDARASWWNGEELVQLTKDHTMLGRPYRFLGRHRTIGGDALSLQLWAGEYSEVTLLLYSDGLWNMMSPMVATPVSKQIELAKTVEKTAVEGATAGDDNITIIRWQARAKQEPPNKEQ